MALGWCGATRVWRGAAARYTATKNSSSSSSRGSSGAAVRLSQAVYDRFRHTLRHCGVDEAVAAATLPRSARALSTCVAFAPFAVLFTPHFHFHAQQLTALGDAIVDDYLSRHLLAYATRSGAVLTTNATRQLNAVLHNHFTMQLFARQLHFDAFALAATTTTADDDDVNNNDDHHHHDDGDDDDAASQTLHFLQAQRRGPSRHDVRGTSFEQRLLPSGQSPLGWRFSHFVGAVHNSLGRRSAYAILQHVYSLDDNDNDEPRQLPRAARALLLRLVDTFPAMNVTEAVLAAQGLSLRFIGKTRMLPDGDDDNNSESNSNDESDDSDDTRSSRATVDATARTATTSSSSSSLLLLSGFGDAITHSAASQAMTGAAATSPTASSSPSIDDVAAALAPPLSAASSTSQPPSPSPSRAAVLASLAAGPGLVDYVATWRARTAALVQRGVVPPLAQALDTAGGGGGDADKRLDDNNDDHGGVGGGWLSVRERAAYARGPAAAHHVDMDAAVARSFADVYGSPHPRDGYCVARVAFRKPVRDPLFYDTQSDLRNGVPLDTNGEPVHTHLDRLRRRHRRLFEVTLCVGGGGGYDVDAAGSGGGSGERVVGRALALRYTLARDAACRAYLGGVLHDLQRLAETTQGDT